MPCLLNSKPLFKKSPIAGPSVEPVVGFWGMPADDDVGAAECTGGVGVVWTGGGVGVVWTGGGVGFFCRHHSGQLDGADDGWPRDVEMHLIASTITMNVAVSALRSSVAVFGIVWIVFISDCKSSGVRSVLRVRTNATHLCTIAVEGVSMSSRGLDARNRDQDIAM
jgi:hypothetical protein